MSLNRFVREAQPLIDILRDPLSPARRPLDYSDAYRDLTILLGNDEIWNSIVEIQEGCASNYVLHNLGNARIEWLKKFRRERIQKAVNQ